MAIPKKTAARIKSGLRQFRRVLEQARHADRSEQDTVTIVTDMLADVFGFNKYTEITGEFAIRGTYCDIAVRLDARVQYLIEVKAIDKTLKDNHLRQATDYAAKEGIDWVVLTNGIEWQAYRMRFERPVQYDHVFTINLLEGGPELVDMVFMLSREGLAKQAIQEYHEQRQALGRHALAAIVLSDKVLNVIRREVRRVTPGVRVDVSDIQEVLTSEVLKRDVVESEELVGAQKDLKKAAGRKLKRKSRAKPAPAPPVAQPNLVAPVAVTSMGTSVDPSLG